MLERANGGPKQGGKKKKERKGQKRKGLIKQSGKTRLREAEMTGRVVVPDQGTGLNPARS